MLRAPGNYAMTEADGRTTHVYMIVEVDVATQTVAIGARRWLDIRHVRAQCARARRLA